MAGIPDTQPVPSAEVCTALLHLLMRAWAHGIAVMPGVSVWVPISEHLSVRYTCMPW